MLASAIVQDCRTAIATGPRPCVVARGIVVAARLLVRIPGPIFALVILNLALQIFDGYATYLGWERFGEANPLLRAAFDTWGAGPTLVVTKLAAGGLLLMIGHAPQRLLVAVGLVFTLTAYTALSLVPWSMRLLG